MVALRTDPYICIQAATGAGKTIFFSELIKRLLNEWPSMRIAVLAHRRELVQQAKDKLLQVWPDAPIGIACASTGEKTNLEQPVTIGSPQTLSNRIETVEAPFDLVIVDEVHRLPPKNKESQYGELLNSLRSLYPKLRMIGVTATPFRLNHGYIYGKECRPGSENWFEKLHYKIGINDLQKQGFLCGYRAKAAANISSDLSRVKTTGGDYNLGALSEMMGREVHIGSAVKAFQKYGEDRHHIVVFAVSIDHAEKLHEAFKSAGYTAGIVHSKMPVGQRDMMLKEFEAGRMRFIVNVGILTEGWDSTAIDCILLCRPTKSSALYAQMVGRGLRIHPNKEDVLILDLTGNCMQHGDPDSPKVVVPGKPVEDMDEPIQKKCPNCDELVAAGKMECPSCGYAWEPEPVEELNESVEMTTVQFGNQKAAPFAFEIDDVYVEDYTSKKGNRMLKLSMVNSSFLSRKAVNVFLLFDPDAHPYAIGKARSTWTELVGNRPPESTDEAMARYDELLSVIPSKIQVVEDGNFYKVHSWGPSSIDEQIPYIEPNTQQLEEDLIPF